MYLLSDLALEAILRKWSPQRYDPPRANIQEWIRAIESLSDTYGIPDTQRPQCAAKFIRGDLQADLEIVLRDARARFGPIHWDRFADFMIAFDRKWDLITVGPLMTEILQANTRNARVGAPFLIVHLSALTRSLPTDRPFHEKHPGLVVGATLGILGSILLAPVC